MILSLLPRGVSTVDRMIFDWRRRMNAKTAYTTNPIRNNILTAIAADVVISSDVIVERNGCIRSLC